MKTIIHTLLITIFFSNISFAQGEKHMQKRKEIMKKQIEFVISELQLTEKEKKEFIPVFKEYNLKKEELFMKKRKRMKYFHRNSLNMSEQELADLADFLVDTDIKIAQLGKEYNDKFANPYSAASFGYIDDVIEPRNTRFRIIRALQTLATKKDTNPPKKHGNIPL